MRNHSGICFRHAIRLEPYLTGPRTELAALLDANGGGGDQVAQLRREELANLERDARLLPDSAITHYRLGLMRYLAGDLAGAQQSLTQATKRAPNSYEFLMALALLYERTEDWDDAVATLEKMRKLRPADPRTRQILQRLNHLRDARN